MTHTYLSNLLPALPFGDRFSRRDQTVQDVVHRLRLVDPGIRECVSLVPEASFEHRSSVLTMNGMRLMATATTPVRIHSEPCSEHASNHRLIIPFVGHASLVADGVALNCMTGACAAFIPDASLLAETSLASFMTIGLDSGRLEHVTRTMQGLAPNSPSGLNLNTPRELSLQVGRVSFEIVFRLLTRAVDQFMYEPDLLDAAGLDDCFYRYISFLLEPKLFLKHSDAKSNSEFSRRKLDIVCDYAISRLHQPITLTALEQVGRMSKRSLHYVFQSRFGCTPMQWVRQERLSLARSQIHSAKNGVSITSIALSCGFTKPARFADYYNQHFGELPSVTLARVIER